MAKPKNIAEAYEVYEQHEGRMLEPTGNPEIHDYGVAGPVTLVRNMKLTTEQQVVVTAQHARDLTKIVEYLKGELRSGIKLCGIGKIENYGISIGKCDELLEDLKL